ncbi:MAG: hypothetical protein IPL09_05890 [Bacteroidetes bacterium]|nr:hypothetical protein [Bacteroidota bacterium]
MENIPVTDFTSFVMGTQELMCRVVETAPECTITGHRSLYGLTDLATQ